MKRFPTLALFLSLWSVAATTVHGFQCNVCHSKNPAMVRMHKAIQAREIGCFNCHKAGEKLLGKAQPKDREASLARRPVDLPCMECHQK